MKQKWEPKNIEISFYATTVEKEKQLIDGAANVLYSYFCQLNTGQSHADSTVTVSSNTRRTGTYA